jgi:23S rRNA pseudouridine1911/1915/1917 synthase
MARPTPVNLMVPAALAGERLDRAIAALASAITRGEARRLIAAGVVFVGGRRTRISSRLVRAGEPIRWEAPARLLPIEIGTEPRIVVERPELWVVDKPAGMPTEPTRAGSVGTLAEWLRRSHGPAYITHRLDVATSGLIVVARDRPAQSRLNRLFATHAVGRRYLAVVSPCPEWTRMKLDAALDGRPAVSHVTVVARSAVAAALIVKLETGRPRQIRRHLALAGFPVVGETVTGVRARARLLLHAFELALPSAGPNSEPLTATASPPADFTTPALALGLTLPPTTATEGEP